jgi:hypothetical protein
MRRARRRARIDSTGRAAAEGGAADGGAGGAAPASNMQVSG